MTDHRRSVITIVIGFALLSPAAVLWLTGLVAPSFTTMWLSLNHSMLGSGDAAPAGLDNYAAWIAQLSNVAFLCITIALSVAATVPGVLAGVAIGSLGRRAGRTVQKILAVVLGMLAVCWAPVGMTLSLWTVSADGVMTTELEPELTILLSTTAIALPVAAGAVGVMTMMLGPLREHRQRTTLVLTFGGACAVVAAASQTFVVPILLSPVGPDARGRSPVLVAADGPIGTGNLGSAAAMMTTLGLLLGLLGLVAGIAGIRGGLRLDFRRTETGTDRPHRAAAVTALAVAAALVVIIVVVHRAWLQSFWHQEPGSLSEQIAVQTWLPSGQVVAIQVVVAALAGAGIGVCRPLGNASSWLLLPFLPWLFVGEGPMLAAHLTATYDPELGPGDSPWYPPVWVNVALIVLFTLLAGAVARGRAAEVGARDLALGTIGIAVAAATVLWIVVAQQLLWPLALWTPSTGLDEAPGPLIPFVAANNHLVPRPPATVGTPVALVVAHLVLVALGTQLGVSRLVLTTRRRPVAGTSGGTVRA